MATVFLALLLCQSAEFSPAIKASADAQKREADLRQVAAVSSRPAASEVEVNSRQYAAARDQEFVEKFNKLITTLMDFSDSYKGGQALDVKKAQAVRKAWLELEKSEPIFQDTGKK